MLQESLSDHIAKFSLFSLRAVLTNYLTVRCIIYHHSALHQLFYCILLSTRYNKPALSTSKSCGWSLEYQFLSVQHEFPQEQAARSTPAYLISSRSVNAGVPDFDHHTRDTTSLSMFLSKCLYPAETCSEEFCQSDVHTGHFCSVCCLLFLHSEFVNIFQKGSHACKTHGVISPHLINTLTIDLSN